MTRGSQWLDSWVKSLNRLLNNMPHEPWSHGFMELCLSRKKLCSQISLTVEGLGALGVLSVSANSAGYLQMDSDCTAVINKHVQLGWNCQSCCFHLYNVSWYQSSHKNYVLLFSLWVFLALYCALSHTQILILDLLSTKGFAPQFTAMNQHLWRYQIRQLSYFSQIIMLLIFDE